MKLFSRMFLCVAVNRPRVGEGHAQMCPEAPEEHDRDHFTRLPGETLTFLWFL